MDSQPTFPWPGLLIAFATTAVLFATGLDPALALTVFIVWAGSLLLGIQREIEPPKPPADPVFSKAGMATMIEHSATPLILSEKNRIIIANKAARNVLGAHVIGQDVRVAFRHPEAIALMDSNEPGQAIITGLARPKDIWSVNRYQMNGELAVIELSSRTAEADISRAHTDFVANASHELRTPLASIIGYAETLSDAPDKIDTPVAQKFVATIYREARRLQSLVNDLMSLSRIEAEKHERPGTRVDLNAAVERAARDAANADNRAERLVIDVHGTYEIAGDEQQIEQLVRNLVDNAFKYGGTESAVTVRLSQATNGDAQLEVRDQGDGIAAEHLPHLTRRFYRTDPGRSLASGGTGLGLAIVKHIVQRHRGRLDIESEVGVGTSIKVRIPLWRDLDADGKRSGTDANDAALSAEKGPLS